MSDAQQQRQTRAIDSGLRPIPGLAQLSIVETSLCPLNSRVSLQPELTHSVSFRYTDPSDGTRKTAKVRITAAKGLSAKDEYLLWGLLAVTLNQTDPGPELWVSQDYVNRQLGFEKRSERGGYRSSCFKDALYRLAYVIYDADAFYLPDMNEYRPLVMGILKYDRPQDLQSKRQWRIAWDPKFFELCRHSSGGLFFDLKTFRELDCATRRLFLLLLKIFSQGRKSPRFDIERLAVDVLGYQPGLPVKKYKQNVSRCVQEMASRGIVQLSPDASNVEHLYRKDGVGQYSIRFDPGPYFRQDLRQSRQVKPSSDVVGSPHYDPLKQIGFSEKEIAVIVDRHKSKHINLAADITLRAMEGGKDVPKIRKTPKAFFRYYLKSLADKTATPPDWYRNTRERQKRERLRQNLPHFSEVYQEAYNRGLQSFLDEQKRSDRYNHFKQVFLAQHLNSMSQDQAVSAAERDALQKLEDDFEFPEESIWLQRHYEQLKSPE